MIIKAVNDPDEIKTLIAMDYDAITSDNDPQIEEYSPSFDGVDYVGGYVNGELVGIMAFKQSSGVSWCHIMTSPNHRVHAGRFARRAIADRGPLKTSIPASHENVIRFAEKFGFICVATERNAWVKNGTESDIIVMRRDG